MMNGKMLAQALLQTRGEELRMAYALVLKTNIIGMMATKTKDFFSKESDHSNEALKAEMKKLERFSDEELQVKLFTEMTKILDLPGVRYDSPLEIEMQAEAIIQAVHAGMLKDDKDYETFVSSAEDREIYQLIIHHQMQKVFSIFDSKFRELDEKKATDFTKQMQGFLMDLPEEQQQELKGRLGIDELTAEVIRTAIVTQGAVVVFSAIVEVAGFEAPLFSLLISPFVLIPLALGGGGLLLKPPTKSMKKKLLPVGILQLILPLFVRPRIGEVDFAPFIAHWKKQEARYRELVEKRNQHEEAILAKEAERKHHEERRESHVQMREAEQEKALVYKLFIGRHITTMPVEERTYAIQAGIDAITFKAEEMESLERQKEGNRARKGLWRTISATIDNTKLSVRKKQLQKEIEEKRDELVEEFLTIEGSFLQEERERLLSHRMNAAEQREKALIHDASATAAKEKAKELKNRLKIVNDQLKQLQSAYYGLEHIG
ncbi:MAG: hypothetical protein ACI33P_13915 [Lysinibacillus sp.]